MLGKGNRRGDRASAKGHLSYEDWISRHDRLSEADRTLIRSHIAAFTRTPRLSVLLALHADEPRYVREALASVMAQLYDEWELCIVADASVSPTSLAAVEEIARSDPRVRLSVLGNAVTAAARVNEALAAATGEFIVVLDQHDVLAEHALYLVAVRMRQSSTPKDEIDRGGRRSRPYFKPDWDYDLFLGTNVLGRLTATERIFA
jgi:O-antigen biosynthesis protein